MHKKIVHNKENKILESKQSLSYYSMGFCGIIMSSLYQRERYAYYSISEDESHEDNN